MCADYKGVRNVDSPQRMARIASALTLHKPVAVLAAAAASSKVEGGGASRTRAIAVADEIAGDAQNLLKGKIRQEHPEYSPSQVATAARNSAEFVAKPGRPQPKAKPAVKKMVAA